MSTRLVAAITLQKTISVGFPMTSSLLDIMVGLKAVELIEKFQHSSLYFSIACLFTIETFGADGVQFIDEDNRWCFLFG
jgi:hypothetical protein